ncbi:hypothetical protein UFOVP58_140 [uncultured Caudovirales phage]|uniref:Uncharacterized protein n=1 Tax=uncultured Caudovirales phage TaxID=2100421 RepID=A0A6J5KX00_9CAUD|nr:hypothetical protein UFOVP58_140 [uncultured Caudovirales phage]
MSQISEDVKMKGELRIVKRNILGEILQEVTVPNLVVTTGKTFIANRMTSVATTGIMTYMGIGGIIQWPAGSLVASKQYVIGFVGTTDFTLLGAAANTVGTVFTCSGGAQSGTGWASPVLTAGFFVVGQAYTIVSAGSTSFTAIGAANNTVGTTFIATGVGSGTGTASTSQVAIAAPAITDTTLNNEQLRQPLTNIAATAMVSGTTYTILTVGTSSYTSSGATSNTVGVTFVFNGVAVTGTGTVISGGVSSANTVTYGASFGPTVAGNFIVGQTYTIASVGTTSFTAIGASSNTVGVTFVATGVGSGTGTAGTPIALYEAGLFSTVTFASNMLCRTNYSIITKNAGDSIAITWVVTVA